MEKDSARKKFQELLQRQEALKKMQIQMDRELAAEMALPVQEECGPKPAGGRIMSGKRIAAVLLLTAVAGVLVYYGYRAYGYRNHFFPGTTINGIDCSEMTVNQAEDLIRRKVEDYQITVEFRGNQKESISGDAIGYQYVSDGSVEKICQSQNPLFWLRSSFSREQYRIPENVRYREESLKELLRQLPVMQEENQQLPVDAYVEFTGEKFEIVPEVEGNVLKEEQLLNLMEEAVENSITEVSAEEEGVYEQPEIRRDDEGLLREQEQLNRLAAVTVTYQLPYGKEKVLDGTELKNWLVQDKDGNYIKDEEKFQEKLEEFVKTLAEEVNTKGEKRLFTTTSGKEVKVDSKNYGWKIDQKEERKALNDLLENLESVTREPEYSSREIGDENNGLGKNYIEVNLTEQHLYYYRDNQLVLESPLVSGRMTRDRFTPPGIFLLTYKQKDRVLRGAPLPNGQPSYESHVDYWMPFNGGIGLHDASWRGTFGGTIYRYSGSHGCINLPRSKAAQIYQMIDKQTPIVCVYNDGYSLIG